MKRGQADKILKEVEADPLPEKLDFEPIESHRDCYDNVEHKRENVYVALLPTRRTLFQTVTTLAHDVREQLKVGLVAAGQIVVDLPLVHHGQHQRANRAEPAEEHQLIEAVENVIFWPEHGYVPLKISNAMNQW